MADYIKRQNAVDALDRIFDNVPMELTTEILRLRRELRGLSPADVVPVVRCRNCEEYKLKYRWCNLHDARFDPDDYCSYGERKE